MKIISWNVNGLRAIHRKKLILPVIQKEQPDILCIQETKAHPDQLPKELQELENYYSYFSSAQQKGYSGTALYTKQKPIQVKTKYNTEELEGEGRIIEADFNTFILFNIYFPNGGAGNKRVPFKLAFYESFLEYIDALVKNGRDIIFCGDVNTAHKEIDIARPKENEKNTGFLSEERAWIDKVIEHNYVDVFRIFNSNPNQYTYWDYKTRARDRNVGWRLDYFFTNNTFKKQMQSCTHLTHVTGSDHCPIKLVIV